MAVRAVCFLADWLNDSIKTVTHRDAGALVLEESEHLYWILTAEEFENGRAPFWVYRELSQQQENCTDAFWHGRTNKTLRAPCWHGEEVPHGYRKVKLRTKFPSFAYLKRLAALEYLWDATKAALPCAHDPWIRPVADRRALGVVYKSDDDDKGDETAGIERHGFHEIVDPAHPYVPAAPSRRTLVGGGIPMFQVTREIAQHHWDDVTSSCVLEIVHRRQSPSELSERHGIPLRRLHEYARQVRKAIKSDSRNDFAQ
jgi:hypothetical protein